MVAASELSINTRANATSMAQEIFGDGVTVVSASYSGDRNSSGIYTGGDSTSPGVTPGDSGVILSSGKVRDFTNSNGEANQSASTSTNTRGVNNNSDFNEAAGARTYDASYLDVRFVPTGDFMTMQFVFSSDEYPEFENSVYQDFVGVWVNGNFVEMEVGNGDTDPGNLNSTNNENLFINNANGQYNTEMDGFTVTMTLTIPVNSGVINTIRIGIADVSDSSYDSSLLIAGNSMQTVLVAATDSATLYPSGTQVVDVLANDIGTGILTITHINNQPVVVGSVITLNTGQTVQLNADGTLTIAGDGDIEDFNFTYETTDGTNTDIGYVNVSSIPCFVAGTLIETEFGPRAVESLEAGDLILTRDFGLQPMRWIGMCTVPADGAFAPVRIRAGTFGAHDELLVSPQHRVLIRDSLAEILFGETEVLVSAMHLVNDRSVVRVFGGQVTYVHILFDQHQIVFSEGLETESFLPGSETTRCFEQKTINEICTLFPELNPHTGEGYGPAARTTLRRYEAEVLALGLQAA